MVTSELGRLEGLVTTFLDLARQDRLALERVDVTASVRDSVALFRPEAGEGVALHADIEEGLEIRGDPGRLPTVWNNLLRNALQAVGSAGEVRVAARREEGGVRVDVVDDGAGIPEEVLPRIWEPFFSARPDGTGLGLSLVRAIVDRHAGRVEAESVPGQSTRISVWLPGTPDGGKP
jgi:signal transduction histidine kinase